MSAQFTDKAMLALQKMNFTPNPLQPRSVWDGMHGEITVTCNLDGTYSVWACGYFGEGQTHRAYSSVASALRTAKRIADDMKGI